MMQTRCLLMLALLALLVFVPAAAAQDSEIADVFTLFSTEPVVTHGERGEWDGRYTDPGAVVYHDGMFHMFRNGFQGWPASVEIGYLTSPDGLNWTEVSEAPVLMSDDVPFAGVAALASSALVEDDGTWVLYFYTWESQSGNRAPGRIGRATADAPEGPWTVDPEPVLEPGSEGSWDSEMVTAPRVVRTEDGYVMYYAGHDEERGLFAAKIGMATSPDGIEWTKYDDPATTDTLFAESDPVLMTDEENVFVHQPNPILTDDGWEMLYRRMDLGQRNMSLWLAESEDGIHWENALEMPVWGKSSVTGTSAFYFTTLAQREDTQYLYVEGARLDGTDIYVATHEGALVGME
jgi:predicted GH43/DUF377 family glycosyl hydrolase